MWDGDYDAVGISFVLSSRFEPTVWDGDQLKDILRAKNTLFRSEPTAWDGDIRKLRKRLTKVYSFFCSKPTVWDNSPILCYLMLGES